MKIKSFYIKNDQICVMLYDSNTTYALSDIKKVKPKQKLFTTEDGVDIFEGDIFSRVMTPDSDDPWNVVRNVKAVDQLYYTNNVYFKNFSTNQKAEEYVTLNKPKLVTMKELCDSFMVKARPDSKYSYIAEFFSHL